MFYYHNELVQFLIDKATIDSHFIESFSIKMGGHELDAFNRLLGRILIQDIHPDGLKSITFDKCDNIVEEIDEGLLDQLVE